MRSTRGFTATALAFCATATMAGAPGSALADGEEQTVTVTGQAGINGNDEKGAREKAKRDAMRQAVEQVGGVTISSSSVVKNYQLTSDVVRSQADGFVKDFHETSSACDKSTCTVTGQATVTKSGVQDFYNLLLMQAGHPKVAFIVAERMAGQTDFSLGNQERGKTENLMTEYFLERGMKVVDFGGLTGIKLSGGAGSGELSAADAEKLAEKADAQYVVLGSVVGVDAGPVMIQGLRSYNMTLTLKMFSAATHEIVASVTKSNAVACISPNLAPVSCMKMYKSHVVDVASQDLMNKTAKAFTQQVTGERRVQLRLTNAKFGTLNAFVKGLTSLSGVKEAKTTQFKDKNATVDVQLEGGDVNYLAGELASKKVGGVTVEVTGVNNEQVTLEMK